MTPNKKLSGEASVGGAGGAGGDSDGGGDGDYANGDESDWAFHCAQEDKTATKNATLVYESKSYWLSNLQVDINQRQETLAVLVGIHHLLKKFVGQDTTALLKFDSVGEEVRLFKQSSGANSSQAQNKEAVVQTLKAAAVGMQPGLCLIIGHASMNDTTVLHCGSVACYFNLDGRKFCMTAMNGADGQMSVLVNRQPLANNTGTLLKHNDCVILAPTVSFKFVTEKGLKRQAAAVIAGEGSLSEGKGNSACAQGSGGSA